LLELILNKLQHRHELSQILLGEVLHKIVQPFYFLFIQLLHFVLFNVEIFDILAFWQLKQSLLTY